MALNLWLLEGALAPLPLSRNLRRLFTLTAEQIGAKKIVT